MRREREIVGDVRLTRIFDESNGLICEVFEVPKKILLSRKSNQGKVVETYMVDRRIVDSKQYERARVRYEGMPSSNYEYDDFGHVLDEVKSIDIATRGDEHRAEIEPDDAGLEALWRSGMDHLEFVNGRGCLGLLGRKKSVKIFDQLSAAGARSITVLDTEDEQGYLSGGDLVVELPDDKDDRFNVLSQIDSLVSELGYRSANDAGQRFALVKVD